MAYVAGHKAGDKGLKLDFSRSGDLHAKDSPGEGGTEDRAKAAADAGQKQGASVNFRHPEQLLNPSGDATPHLDGAAPSRPVEPPTRWVIKVERKTMGPMRLGTYLPLAMVNMLEDQVVALAGTLAIVLVYIADYHSPGREQKDEARVSLTEVG